MQKNHKNCIRYHKSQLESQKHGFRCRKEFNIVREGRIKQIDLACFRNHPFINAIGIEAESNLSFNSKQVQSNGEDLKEFKRLYPKARTFHINVDEEINFDKELNLMPRFKRLPVKRFR